MNSKKQMLAELEVMLRDAFSVQRRGGAHAELTRAYGYADGYMKAMLHAGLVDDRELLAFVARQRAAVHGPATTEVPSADEMRTQPDMGTVVAA